MIYRQGQRGVGGHQALLTEYRPQQLPPSKTMCCISWWPRNYPQGFLSPLRLQGHPDSVRASKPEGTAGATAEVRRQTLEAGSRAPLPTPGQRPPAPQSPSSGRGLMAPRAQHLPACSPRRPRPPLLSQRSCSLCLGSPSRKSNRRS